MLMAELIIIKGCVVIVAYRVWRLCNVALIMQNGS
jgi:hypothetical protein